MLKKIRNMAVDDMLSYVTEEKGTFVSMAVIDHGETTFHTYANGGQEITALDYKYEIGSITKTMTALLIAKAVAEGRLALCASISDYLDLPKGKYYPTLRRLLTHTSGYKRLYLESEIIGNALRGRNSFYGISKEAVLRKISRISLEDKDYPFVYSNFGASVLGLVLEAIYQKDYTELLTAYLQNELAMKNTSVAACTGNLTNYWCWAPDDAYIPAGAVISDITDMAKYLRFCMSASQSVSPSYASMPFASIKKISFHNSLYESLGIYLDEIGMFWIYDRKNHTFWHNGGTSYFNSHIAMSEDRTKGVVILSNYGPNKKFPVTVIGAKMMQQ